MGFKLCPVNSFSDDATLDCLNQHPISLAPHSRNKAVRDGGLDAHYYQLPDRENKMFNISVVIPDVTCELCVLQWQYRTGGVEH